MFSRFLPDNDGISSSEQKHPRNSRTVIIFNFIYAVLSLSAILMLVILSLNILGGVGSDHACGEGILEVEFMFFKYKLERQFNCVDLVDRKILEKSERSVVSAKRTSLLQSS